MNLKFTMPNESQIDLWWDFEISGFELSSVNFTYFETQTLWSGTPGADFLNLIFGA